MCVCMYVCMYVCMSVFQVHWSMVRVFTCSLEKLEFNPRSSHTKVSENDT